MGTRECGVGGGMGVSEVVCVCVHVWLSKLVGVWELCVRKGMFCVHTYVQMYLRMYAGCVCIYCM